ncbi:peptide-methionine (S)-S-oxide reductase [Gelidibacter maritimus]|uniref:peptide-methionine (S)-S-oxide reductase n=1 Tax=Gelidibacter maritimus TaxID=2761487 RepID=A0A7W2M6C9_9FLAO|nr:peptide-methionine (S)-S-oxide reductase [Gelidibacter maritimus]MBA6153533.1 peptide-methionine (S)-S-oxide reductase [Gelidibacter maritimus]
MVINRSKIGFGGGCHWCTEAIFQSLVGVEKVEQGFVASINSNNSLSEAVIVHFNRKCITLKTLIEIHLLTHSSRSSHSMRQKYRSAIYTFDTSQEEAVNSLMVKFQNHFNEKLITKVLPFRYFEASRENFINYYFKNPKKPFCETFIDPKLKLLLQQFSQYVNPDKVVHLQQ